MKNYILFLCALMTIVLASSCKSPTDFDTDRWNDKDTTNYPASQELAGEWILISYEKFGMPIDYVELSEFYSLNFETSKKVSGKVNCNTFTAKYQAGTTLVNGSTSDKEIDFEDIVSTKMNCGTAEDDAKFLTALNASVQYFVFDKTLEITYIGGNSTQSQRMIFKRKQAPNNDFDLLKGSEWTLVSFEQFGTAPEWIPLAQQENLNISFMGDSLATGMAECYKFSAEYWTNNKPLPGTTDYPLGMNITNSVPCNGNYGNRFLAALAGAKQYYRYADSLEITYSPDNGITLSRMMFVQKGNSWNPKDTNTTAKTTLVSEIPTTNIPTDQFVITQKYPVVSNILKLGVQFSGGCALHEFEMFGKATSGGVELLLTHEDNNDPCDALLNTDVSFDLTKFVEEYKKFTGKKNGQLILVMKNTGNSEVHAFQFQF